MWWRRRKDQDFRNEIRSHIEFETDRLIGEGLEPDAARTAARRRFGNVRTTEEQFYESRRILWLDHFLQDLRYALRTFRRNPGFTFAAVVILALGIGANTAIFSLIDILILRELPVREPGRLVELLSIYPGDPRVNSFSREAYEYFRDQNTVFSGLVGVSGPSPVRLGRDGSEVEAVSGQYAVGDFFPVLGMRPALGRLLDPEDDMPGAAAVAVVSWSLWQNRFNGDSAILGESIVVNGLPATVVGVTPREFFGLQVGFRTDIWLPAATAPMARNPPSLQLMGRLRPEASIEQARAEMRVLDQWRVERWTAESDDPLIRQVRIEVEPAAAGFSQLRDLFAGPLLALMAVVGLLLTIACMNVASMLLARAASRQREMAVRISVGAGRLRLVRQVLTESLLLSTAGALIGIAVAYLGASALTRILASGRPIVGFPGPVDIQAQVDLRVLFFTLELAVSTGLLFGLAPAWNAFVAVPASSLRAGGTAGHTKSRQRLGRRLFVAQVAMSVVLLSAAGLFLLRLSNLRNHDLGFQHDSVLLLTLQPERGQRSRLFGPYQEVLERMETIPGVRSATLAGPSPISGAAASRFVNVEGEESENRPRVLLAWIAPRYFETLGTPLLAGRDFRFDDAGRQRVAIVNEAMARRYFGGSAAVGRRVTLGDGDEPYEIIGVARDAKYLDLREPPPEAIYLNDFQEEVMYSNEVLLRTDGPPVALADEARRVVSDVLPSVPVAKVTTLTDQLNASIVAERLIAVLSGLLAGLGAILLAVGMYGLLAYTVARRTNEIGVRMALGASRSDMTRMVLKGTLGLVSAGLAIGLPAAFGMQYFAGRFIDNLSVNGTLPIFFAAAAMIVICLLAAYLPARRAAGVHPVRALRHE